MRDVLAFAVDCCWWWWSCCASVVADVLRIRATGEGKKLIYSNSRSTAPGGHYFNYDANDNNDSLVNVVNVLRLLRL